MTRIYGKEQIRKTRLMVGYPAFGTSWKNKKYNFFAHHIVWLQFNPDSKMLGMHINHKDNNRTNNHISNLELVTPQQNTLHALDNGFGDRYRNAGDKCASAKITWEQALFIKAHKDILTNVEMLGLFPLSISQINLITKDGSFKLKHCPDHLRQSELYQFAEHKILHCEKKFANRWARRARTLPCAP